MAVSHNFTQFSHRMDIRAGQIGRNLPKLMQKVALAVHREVVLGTPVDTGKARSNWQVSVGVPAPHTIPPYAPGSKLGLAEAANAQAALAQGVSALAGYGSPTTIWITNNVHYIGILNTGSSAQAGAFFVQTAALHGALVASRGRLFDG